MRRAMAPVATLLFGTAILLTGQGLQGTLIPVRASLEAFFTISIVLMGTAYFFGFTYGCLKGSRLIGNVEFVMVSAGLLFMYGAGAIAGPFIASAMMAMGDAVQRRAGVDANALTDLRR